MEIKTKIKKCNQLKSFCTAKETMTKTKRQHTDWEKIFANNVANKVLVLKIYQKIILKCMQNMHQDRPFDGL